MSKERKTITLGRMFFSDVLSTYQEEADTKDTLLPICIERKL